MAAKESEELMKGLRILVPILVVQFKDGFQVSDAAELIAKLLPRKDELVQAFSGLGDLKAEWQGMTPEQVIQEAGVIAPECVGLVLDIMAAVKK